MLPWSISLMGGCMHSCRDFFLGLFCWCLSQTRDLSGWRPRIFRCKPRGETSLHLLARHFVSGLGRSASIFHVLSAAQIRMDAVNNFRRGARGRDAPRGVEENPVSCGVSAVSGRSEDAKRAKAHEAHEVRCLARPGCLSTRDRCGTPAGLNRLAARQVERRCIWPRSSGRVTWLSCCWMRKPLWRSRMTEASAGRRWTLRCGWTSE